MTAQLTLYLAGAFSAVASALHLAIIAGGARWYRFFGAGERMARMAERGQIRAALITLAIALVLAGWSAYALSGAGLLPALPLLRPVLYAIGAIYLLRGCVVFAMLLFARARLTPFWVCSSLICLAGAALYLGGVQALE